MKYLVCDTNIWYGIADGTIHPHILKNFALVGTGINIVEFAETAMLISNPELVKSGVMAMKKYHSKIFKNNFYDHIICLFDEEFQPDDTASDQILENMEILLNINVDKIPKTNIAGTQRRVGEILEKKGLITDKFNEKLTNERKVLQDISIRKEYKKASHTLSNRRYIASLIKDYYQKFYNGVINISEDNQNWGKLDFFMHTWDIYTRMLDLQKDMNLDKNDLADLFNLVYVQPGFKYATRDSKWVSIFKQNPILSEYFIEI